MTCYIIDKPALTFYKSHLVLMTCKIKIICSLVFLSSLIFSPLAHALEINQLAYRSAILLALPDGYQYSLEDLLAPFKMDPKIIPTLPSSGAPIELVLRAERNLITLAVADRKGDNEVPIASRVPLPQLRARVDAYLDTLEPAVHPESSPSAPLSQRGK